MDHLCDYDGNTLRRLLAVGSISSRQVAEASIDRIEALNPELNAFVAASFSEALVAADMADRNRKAGKDIGPLAGLPVAVKDLNDVAGLPTTFGSPLYADNVAEADDDVVASIKSSGGIVFGKTNVPEHGFGATTTNPLFGSSRNPFDPRLSAGASTGGGAVAVASGMVPYASGSDFAGSLRTPASFCGISGMRPSNGVVATKRRSMAWSSFDVEGPLARTAADCKRLLAAMSRSDRCDPLSVSPDLRLFRPPEMVNLGGLRVAVSDDLGFAPMSMANRAAFREKLARFANLFASVEEAHPDLDDAERIFMTLRGVGFVTDFGPMEAEFGAKLGPVVLDELDRARSIGAEEIGWAMKAHTTVFRKSVSFFENYDILITPAAAVSPFPHEDVFPRNIDGEDMHGYLIWEGIAWGITLTQCPAAVIPCGRDAQGLPFGIQIVAGHHQDGWLLDVAHTLETAFMGDGELGRPRFDMKRPIQSKN